MAILRPQSEFGYAPPPQTPYSVITNIPGWSVAQAIRDGDPGPMQKIVHLYPRFVPMHFTAQLGQAIAKHVGLEGKAALIYLDPVIWPYTLRHITHESRGKHRIKADDVTLKCVDIAGHRVYAILFEPRNMPALKLSWQNPGIGISIRGAEYLLRGLDSLKEVPFEENDIPAPTWTAEGSAHQGLRERITELLHRSLIDSDKVKCTQEDVFLYPTGMAAVFHTGNMLIKHRPGTIVVLGIAFHNTYHHLIEECPHGWKHFGGVDDEDLLVMENWLGEEKHAGRPLTPTQSDKYGVVLVVDDTISGFANVDVLAQSDLVITSLTKTFSGQANVMGGSVVLNPLSPHYQTLKPLIKASHHNELFASDAEVLLANSHDFLHRTSIINRNALAMANFLCKATSIPYSPVINVQYPGLLPTKTNYDAVMRRGTPDLPEPGYGCLMTVEFSDIQSAIAFYHRCGFYPSPHLGGHVTIMIAYNMLVFGKKPEEQAYMRGLGVKEESVRISAGLEDEGDLIDTLRDALEAAIEAKRGLSSKG
ncbi:hypothetical protein FZEAL_7361 [Fusarium zealandicum]|uniref:Cystathionine gamma-synthase n=1 Tax=Fusarium zealandicum TaxID=1053134 RepID=A0A8H4XHV8_9HYPO|nr:hypothetical protein FZEAL_7361 [Fusarium zealandicum]